jgi:hypothetical protein
MWPNLLWYGNHFSSAGIIIFLELRFPQAEILNEGFKQV